MIRVIFEPCIPFTHIKNEIWYPEINKKVDEYFSYLYHEAGRIKGLTVITYSPFILECLEVISKSRDIPMEVEMNGMYFTENFENVYLNHCRAMQNVDNIKWKLEDSE